MRAHIVHTHPEPNSFVAAMRDIAIARLVEQGFEITISDLYEMGFNPLLSRDDFGDLSDPERLAYTREQRLGWENGSLAPDIREEVERVLSADLLVLTFPVYWFSVPALLKGWIDRIFLAGPFYDGRHMYDKGGMVGRRALVIASLGGREHMFGPNAVHGEFERGMLQHLLQGTLGVVGYDVLQPFFAYHAPYVDDEARADILSRLNTHVSNLDQLPKLKMPSLNNFDKRFAPLDPGGGMS